jgi:hypothetical protein
MVEDDEGEMIIMWRTFGTGLHLHWAQIPRIYHVYITVNTRACCLETYIVFFVKSSFLLQEKAAEATKQKEEKRGGNLSPRNMKACHSVSGTVLLRNETYIECFHLLMFTDGFRDGVFNNLIFLQEKKWKSPSKREKEEKNPQA